MYKDPLFLIGLMGAIGCIGWWILDNLRGDGSEELEEKLNLIGLVFSVLIIWRLFVNAGDLGILLFFGSIILYEILDFLALNIQPASELSVINILISISNLLDLDRSINS